MTDWSVFTDAPLPRAQALLKELHPDWSPAPKSSANLEDGMLEIGAKLDTVVDFFGIYGEGKAKQYLDALHQMGFEAFALSEYDIEQSLA